MSKPRLSICIVFSLLFHLTFLTLLILWTRGWFEKRSLREGGGGPILLINVGGPSGEGTEKEKGTTEEIKAGSTPTPKARIEKTPLPKKREWVLTEKADPSIPSSSGEKEGGEDAKDGGGLPGGGGEGALGSRGSGKGGEGGTNILSEIRKRIERAKRYPLQARLRQIEGVVRLSFRIGEDGGVSDLKILGSSGSPVLDEEALATVRRATPLPFYPESIRISLRFSLESP